MHDSADGPVNAIKDAAPDPFAGHAEQYRPLAAYGVLAGVFNAGLVGFLIASERKGKLPERWAPSDLALMAVGTMKLSRLLAKDRVTSAIRAPFTRFQDDAGHGEVDEAARGRGLRRAVGELLVCDYCLGQWVAAGYLVGFSLAPRPTRAVAAMYTAYAGADAVQLAWSRTLESGS